MSKAKNVPNEFTNGWLSQLDQRTEIAQIMQRRYNILTDDLGGVNSLSYQQRSLVERSLWLEYWLADQERLLAQGKPFEVAKWTQACNSLQGLYAKLGLHKLTQTKDISDYLSGI